MLMIKPNGYNEYIPVLKVTVKTSKLGKTETFYKFEDKLNKFSLMLNCVSLRFKDGDDIQPNLKED